MKSIDSCEEILYKSAVLDRMDRILKHYLQPHQSTFYTTEVVKIYTFYCDCMLLKNSDQYCYLTMAVPIEYCLYNP